MAPTDKVVRDVGAIATHFRVTSQGVFMEGLTWMTEPTRDPLLVEREKTHGDFRSTAEIAQRFKKIIEDNTSQTTHVKYCNVHREALDMICTKIARIISGNPAEEDHWKDIAGYAKLGSEACE